MPTVHLHHGLGQRRVARLRDPAGYDERVGASDATALVDLLLVGGEGWIGPGEAHAIALCDRDAIAAAIHAGLFGDAIAADTACESCGKAYEVRFSLRALVATRTPQAPPDLAAGAEPGWFRLTGGACFRLPNQADLDAVAGLAAEAAVAALRARQIRETGNADPAHLDDAIAALCPVLDCDLEAPCPHCRTGREVRFSVPRYLERALAAEQPLLLREVHCLARAYGWSHDEIMRLPRSERRAFASLVTGESAGTALFRRSA